METQGMTGSGLAHTCAFTGYRPHKMPFVSEDDIDCVNFKQRLRETIRMLIGIGYCRFISGGAMGMDTWAAEAVLELQTMYPYITLELAIPFEGQAAKWSQTDRERYEALRAMADRVTVISQTYDKGCMFRRNRYMAEQAGVMLACYDGKPGGTRMTVDLARTLGRQVILLNPLNNRVQSA